MNLLICHSGDTEALWLYARLKQCQSPIELVNADVLPCALRWNYRISKEEIALDIQLANKKHLSKGNINVVINRTGTAHPALWQRSDPADRQYVTQEMHAFFLSWLHTLSREALLLNPPGDNGLSGYYYSQPQWMSMAHEAGLPVGCFTEGTHPLTERGFFSAGCLPGNETNILVLKNKVFGMTVPPRIAASCIELARISGNSLLEISLERQNRWQFKSANPFPHFIPYGKPFIDYILQLLN